MDEEQIETRSSGWAWLLTQTAVWTALGALGTGLTLPYAEAIMPEMFEMLDTLGITMPLLIVLQVVGNGVFFLPFALVAWAAARSVGLRADVVDWALLGRTRPESLGRKLGRSVGWGFACGAGILGFALAMDATGLMPEPPQDIEVTVAVALAASFGAGLSEEFMLRLCLAAPLAWLIAWPMGRPARPWVFGVAFTLAALAFAALHLPQAFTLYGDAVGPALIGFIITMNGAVGLVFGWLFWRDGLEFAVVAHVSTDLILHVLPAAVVAIGGS